MVKQIVLNSFIALTAVSKGVNSGEAIQLGLKQQKTNGIDDTVSVKSKAGVGKIQSQFKEGDMVQVKNDFKQMSACLLKCDDIRFLESGSVGTVLSVDEDSAEIDFGRFVVGKVVIYKCNWMDLEVFPRQKDSEEVQRKQSDSEEQKEKPAANNSEHYMSPPTTASPPSGDNSSRHYMSPPKPNVDSSEPEGNMSPDVQHRVQHNKKETWQGYQEEPQNSNCEKSDEELAGEELLNQESTPTQSLCSSILSGAADMVHQTKDAFNNPYFLLANAVAIHQWFSIQ